MVNAASQPAENELVKATVDEMIWAIVMPRNVTPLIQPMDEYAIKLTELRHRNYLLNKING